MSNAEKKKRSRGFGEVFLRKRLENALIFQENIVQYNMMVKCRSTAYHNEK